MKDLIVIVNSSNRQKQITLGQLNKTKYQSRSFFEFYLAVPSDQKEMYENITDRLIPIPSKYNDLPSQRQWCMENLTAKYIFFMDDDLTFLIRNKELKLEKCESSDTLGMVESVYHELTQNNIPIVGVSTRLGNNRVIADYEDNCRVTRCYAINREIFKKVGARFDPIPKFVMEDFHITLSFLNAGYPNRVLYTYAQNDVGSNAEGGCSLYRNAEAQRQTSLWMAKHHPEVTLKTKTSKTGWQGMESRLDVTVQWKKAFKPKIEKVGGVVGISKYF